MKSSRDVGIERIRSLGLRATSVVASVGQLALYHALGTSTEFLGATTALLLVGLAIALSDPGLGLLVSRSEAEGNRGDSTQLTQIRICLAAAAGVVGFLLSDALTRRYALALSGFWIASIARTLIFPVLRIHRPDRYEFSIGALLNLVDSLVAIITLCLGGTVLQSFLAYSLSALISTGPVAIQYVRVPRPPGPARRGRSFLTMAFVDGMPAFASGLVIKVVGLAVAGSSTSDLAGPQLVGILRIVDAGFVLSVGFTVLPGFVNQLRGETVRARRLELPMALGLLGILPFISLLILWDPHTINWERIGELVLISGIASGALLMSTLAHAATATGRSRKAMPVVIVLAAATLTVRWDPTWVLASSAGTIALANLIIAAGLDGSRFRSHR